MDAIDRSYRLKRLQAVAGWAALLLGAKVLVTIVWEYRFYFPPDFDAAFLTGRRELFVGIYRAAFYAHIIASPLAIIFAVLLMISGLRGRFPRVHRWLGRLQCIMVLTVVAPTGMIMAQYAHSGWVAAWGFSVLAVATTLTAMMTAVQAWRGQFASHQRWATRCSVLLLSPLVLRLVAGALVVLQADTDASYRWNAWLSWLVPLVVYEMTLRWRARGAEQPVRRNTTYRQKEAWE